MHTLSYADPGLTDAARKTLHDATVTHIVEVVDGYLLGTVMLIFSLGLDDLKSRLAKVILMIMIVTLFEEALNMEMSAPIDLFYLGGSIALIALALYLTHVSEHGAKGGEVSPHEQEKY